MDEFDLVVIGAGWYGLVAAKTYLQLHPSCTLVVLDAGSSVGGTWAQSRLYPGLKSNNMLGTFEYSDFPMDPVTFGLTPGEHIPGPTVHKYLAAYAQHFGIHEHIRFNTRVEIAEMSDPSSDGWILSVQHLKTGEKGHVHARKLVVATGLTSEPHVPSIAGSHVFSAPLFHAKDFAAHSETLRTARNVTVLGGAKSAWDVAYAYAAAGVGVDMVIRKSGRGPVWMAPPYVTPLKKWLEKLVHTRFLTWFSPCMWGAEDGFGRVRWLLHGTWFGRKVVDAFWRILGDDVVTLIGFDKHPEVKKLQPWHGAFWIGAGLSILNYPTDFFEFVRNGTIRVHIADVDRLSERTVCLANGEEIKTDVLVCATGWKARPSITFLSPGGATELDMFHSLPASDELSHRADALILQQFPRLQDQPKLAFSHDDGKDGSRAEEVLRLYRFMVPPSTLTDRNIAFAGLCTSIATSVCAQAQSLWISAYFDGQLDRLPDQETAEWESVLHSQFTRWRYPCGYGARLPDFVFDAVPYVDMLLHDLGLESHRKKGKVAEVFEAYGPEDYKQLPEEWAQKHGGSLRNGV